MNIGIIASQYRSGVVVPPGDTTIPVITLTGGNLTIDEGVPYVEPGYSASDNVDGNITGNVVVNYGGLNTSNPAEGVYTVTYNVTDSAGNNAVQKSRTVTVEAVEVDNEAPTAPGNVQISGIDYDSATVTWTASTDNVGVVGYDVMVSYLGGSYQAYTPSPITDLTFELSGGQIYPGVGNLRSEYDVKVRAYDAAGNFTDSAVVTFETWAYAGQSFITVEELSDTVYSFNWNEFTAGTFPIAGYNIYLNGVKQNANLLTTREWEFTGLTPGTTYNYKIAGVDTNGGFRPDPPLEFTTTGTAPASVVSDVTYASTFGGGQNFGYKKYIPGSYNAGSPMPLVIWLHGLGERSTGSGNPQFYKLAYYGPFWEIANNNREYNFLMIAPQQPETINSTNYSSWHDQVINESVEHFKSSGYNVDLDRVYITGQSMGGGGVFTYMRYHGNKIAAAIAICPTATQTGQMCIANIKNKPLWLIHNRNDNTVNISSTYSYINNMLACSPAPTLEPKATIYEGSSVHNGWQATYGEYSPGTLSSDANISIPNGYNEPYPESGTGLNWHEWLLQYSL